ncbi:MAG: hypothetical protein GEU82_07920 [Luteitalea sp.]|nr:hypothetical protein [Luteitalea sp.]
MQSLLAGGAILLALLALFTARRAVRRLERITESYWELRYESGQLKARLTRVETASGLREAEEEPRPAVPTAFVPLSSLKK